jgi:DNA-directed RNA polymerase subunit RPC12/RpoP
MDLMVNRIYKCEKCEGEVLYKENCSKSFRKRCPLCNKNGLLLKEGHINMDIFVDMKKSKTLGSQSDLNYKKLEKEQEIKKVQNPWWRKNKKINFDVLKNPTRYINEGKL